MNVVNFSDGIDGLAAGVCAISAAAFAVIAFDLQQATPPACSPLITAGAALGFLVHNFHPASVFMGDCGSNLLGLLLGGVIVEGSLKTNALIALIVPLVVLAVPFLDTDVRGRQADQVRAARSTRPTRTTSTTASAASASRSGARCSTCTAGR